VVTGTKEKEMRKEEREEERGKRKKDKCTSHFNASILCIFKEE
jgi:hypothetical protein